MAVWAISPLASVMATPFCISACAVEQQLAFMKQHGVSELHAEVWEVGLADVIAADARELVAAAQPVRLDARLKRALQHRVAGDLAEVPGLIIMREGKRRRRFNKRTNERLTNQKKVAIDRVKQLTSC